MIYFTLTAEEIDLLLGGLGWMEHEATHEMTQEFYDMRNRLFDAYWQVEGKWHPDDRRNK